MAVKQYAYKGKGRIHIRKKVPGALWREIGNCSKLEFSVDENTEEMLDYQDGGGGVLESDTQISAVKGAVECYNMSPENIALGLRGVVTNRSAADVTAEEVTASLGSIIPLDRLQDMAQPMTVTNDTATVTYDAGVDYSRSRAGIVILAGGIITEGAALKVTYKAVADNVIETMAASSEDYEILFDGLNDARSGKPVRVTCHKNVFSPTKGLGFITDTFATQELEFTCKKDESIVGLSLSKYIKIEVAEV